MLRNSLVLGTLLACSAWGQAPAYTAADFLNASDYAPGPFAPNSVLAVFGTNLSWTTHALSSDDIVANTVPGMLIGAGVEVFVDNVPAPLLYVSPTQINFIVPSNEISGDVKVRVVRQGVTGPEVTLTLVDSAPAVFTLSPGSVNVIAQQHGDYSLITPNSPAHGGDIVVLYATGLGRTQPNPRPGEIPQTAALMESLNSLTVSLDGSALPSFRIKYAGATAFCVGLYQINIELPSDVGNDPEIRVAVGAQSSPAGLRIPVR
jgi:uncharacterized protein (TIGR03437 family)